ncbi:hypothetical protein BKK79_16845 [Cupriavidus sp. USMAA2-4]|uniref:phosphoethanolamine transferase n=1 Tax=Cupriavidus sp. USMAA2-4 TaxID=876364 RepID=UPI0008A6823D|nr:phosphoethanolamine transferase [Cupriavidus sp. USMAA2-4]AOY93284.1 hypothetical protein BKK79_16845 [Cupriavidus sp. USMAA2-4]
MHQVPPPHQRATLPAAQVSLLSGCALLGACAALLLECGVPWRDAGKTVLMLALSLLMTRLLPASAWARMPAMAWYGLLLADAGLEAFLQGAYGLSSDSPAVLTALGNTNRDEAGEFLRALPLGWTGGVIAMLPLLYLACWRLGRPRAHGWRPAACVPLALFVAAHFNPTAREKNPIFGWARAVAKYRAWQAELAGMQARQHSAGQWLAAQPFRYTGPERRTVVLVVGESINRENWQIYGYDRATSPRLAALRDELLVFDAVTSGAGTTVPAMRAMLTLGPDDSRGPGVTALARLAGYKTYWLSNQADSYLWTRYAGEAEVRRQANRDQDGRDAESLDESLLPMLDAALADPAPRKFIVIHMLGAHPHYDMRYPAEWEPFAAPDEIDRQLADQGRWPWIRLARRHYDRALHYHDALLGRMLESLRRQPRGEAALLYTSDHGQEVGHSRNFAGHAPGRPAGHAVPLLVWPRHASAPELRLESRPFNTARLEGTLVPLLRIETPLVHPRDDLLSAQFVAEPRHPARHAYLE